MMRFYSFASQSYIAGAAWGYSAECERKEYNHDPVTHTLTRSVNTAVSDRSLTARAGAVDTELTQLDSVDGVVVAMYHDKPWRDSAGAAANLHPRPFWMCELHTKPYSRSGMNATCDICKKATKTTHKCAAAEACEYDVCQVCFGELKGTAVKCGKCNGKLVESVPRHVDVFWFHEAADGEPDAATGRVKVKYIQPHAVKCCMPKCTCEKWHPVRQSLTAVRPPVLFARDRKKYFKKSAGDALRYKLADGWDQRVLDAITSDTTLFDGTVQLL